MRQDNADTRLSEIGHKVGLLDETQYNRYLQKQDTIKNEIQRLKDTKLSATAKTNEILEKYGEHIDKGIRLSELIKRPNVDYKLLKELDVATKTLDLPKDVYEQVEILIKYDGYLKRQEQQVDNADKLEKIKIPKDIDYSQIGHISTETREMLEKIRPTTLAQASRIGGVKPADLSVLMVMLEKHMIHS